jgi:long-chain acyl-CoA synthetase
MAEVRTLPELFHASCERWAHRPAYRHTQGNTFVAIRYQAVLDEVAKVASALQALEVKKGDCIAVFAESSPVWCMLDWAALSLGAITVPIFPTVGEETVAYILKDSASKIVFAGDAKLAGKAECAARNVGAEPLIVSLTGKWPYVYSSFLTEANPEFTTAKWRDISALVEPDDVASIIYTSGTTGEPKGAVLSHRAFVHQCAAVHKNLPVDERDVFFCLLPLSHVYARLADHFLPFAVGAEVVFAESLKTLANDIRATEPTIVPAVPRFLESVRAKLLSAVSEAPALRRFLFRKLLSTGPRRLRGQGIGFFGSILDKVVGGKVRERFGGRVRFFVSGGAALPLDLAEFFASFGMSILQGYGLTETAPVISINHPARNRADSVGEVLEGLEVRIADDGEILMRGDSLMDGYHQKPKDTAEAIDADGWFHTGDIGKLEGRRLWITDRKKDIIVLSNGKNVAPAAIEAALKSSEFIDEAMVFGDGLDHVSALIVPSFEALLHRCRGQEIDRSHRGDMVEAPAAQQVLKQEIERINQRLGDFEKIRGYKVMKAPWTQETGELTPSLKVRRPYVREKYAAEMEALR